MSNLEGPRLPDPRMIPQWQAPPPRRAVDDDGPPPAPGRHAEDPLIRPFFVTGGRTLPLQDGLRIETLVSAQPWAAHAPLRFEAQQIVELCQSPRSVAEIASGLGVPVGVAKVLIADLATDGYVTCHQTVEIPIDIIERIRDRVRAL
ncbi:DUF742 domain-containing protein [Luedemannella flava]|uniref:DUF742 domain-containing protein n=1 Tax=Luedemannella flava TaxID=349316 RepID=A0ABN2M3X6_9ACTN